jgi:hypothetical protein
LNVDQVLNEFKKSGARSDGQASEASRRPRDQIKEGNNDG